MAGVTAQSWVRHHSLDLQAANREGVTVVQLDVARCATCCSNGAAHARTQRLAAGRNAGDDLQQQQQHSVRRRQDSG